ncbi:MAG: NADH-quinone oxidoreductase subunit I [Oligoflexales bacterium]|nr:NADH-quinone oxidoreductase subunit I [Oligoflexales bacterium]
MATIKVERPPQDKNVFASTWGYFTSISSGMWLTLKIFFKQLLRIEPSETLEWPEAPATYGERFKGKHFLTKREDGQVRCTACFLCATACPAQCIHIEAGQHPNNELEKFPIRFEIDILRCVFCGYCEEACPVDAIRLGPEYAMADTAQKKWVYTKDYLVDRKELSGGVHSVKVENEKHPSIDHLPSGEERRSLVRHGHHD